MERLRRYPWPGNVRELQSILKQALLRAQGTMLMPEFLPDMLVAPAASGPARHQDFDLGFFIDQRLRAGTTDLHAEARLEMDRVLLAATLRFVNGNQLQAAKMLGIARETLRNRLRELGLNITASVTAAKAGASPA
jgi:two-component system nitrogen regulation response regulator GlnG